MLFKHSIFMSRYCTSRAKRLATYNAEDLYAKNFPPGEKYGKSHCVIHTEFLEGDK